MAKKIKIGIIGLGYVGFPLANEFAKKFEVKGFDLSKQRINQLKNNHDSTGEIDNINGSIFLTHNYKDLSDCNYFIVTVPTPVDKSNRPDVSSPTKSKCRYW